MLYKTITPNVDNEDDQIIYNRTRHYLLRKEIETNSSNMDKKLKEYIFYSQYLAGHGRIFDCAEITFGKYNNISYKNYVDEYKEYLKANKKLREEELRKKKKEQLKQNLGGVNNAINSVGEVLISGLLALPFAFFGAIFSSIGKKR